MRIPWRSDSSRSAVMPSMTLSRLKFAMVSMTRALFTWYGISVTTILCLPLDISSMVARARILTLPRPVEYAFLMPSRPKMSAPVGKSGPLIAVINSSTVTSGLSMSIARPLHTSLRLCGGIFVAIPTAIPLEPLMRRFGIFAGNTVGSCKLSS